jgi:hypothetical protein
MIYSVDFTLQKFHTDLCYERERERERVYACQYVDLLSALDLRMHACMYVYMYGVGMQHVCNVCMHCTHVYIIYAYMHKCIYHRITVYTYACKQVHQFDQLTPLNFAPFFLASPKPRVVQNSKRFLYLHYQNLFFRQQGDSSGAVGSVEGR